MVDALIAKEFAGYRIDSRVGRGGMGVVYKATDLTLDRTVALKVLDDELAKDHGFRRRFVTESKLAASLDHPNVIPIYAAGEFDGMPFIAMRFVPGHDLRAVLQAEGRLDQGRAVRLVAQVASALDAAHAAGLVHRDVKPANVLVTPEDHVYLTDFGLTKRVAADTEATRTGVVLGTLNYMAPEQIRGQAIGPYTDIYSLGCLIVHVLTGQVPFPVDTEEGKLWAHMSEPPPRPSARVRGLTTAFDPVVARAMSKLPGDRHPTAGDVGLAMQAALREPAERRPGGPGSVAGVRPEGETRGEAARSAGAGTGAGTAQRSPAPAKPKADPPAPVPERREVLVAALADRFNVVVLAGLLVVGAALGAIGLMVPLALVVYAAGVVRSYKDPATARRVAATRRQR